MHPGRHGQGRHRHRGGGAADADYVGTGFALVLSAVSYLLLVDGGGQPASTPAGMEWQVILAFGTMAGGLLLIMHGIRAHGARPPALVRRIAGAVPVLWHAGGPERLLPVMALLLLPFLEAWFDFF